MIPSFLGLFCSSIFVDGCERGQGGGPGGMAGGASLAPINKNREHDGPCLHPYIDHIWPGIITTIDVRRIDYIDHGITIASDVRALSIINGHGITTASDVRTTYSQRGITTTSDVQTTYYHLDDLDRAIVQSTNHDRIIF